MRAHEIWREIENETGASLLTTNGGLVISSDGKLSKTHVDGFFQNTVGAAKRFGIPHELLDAAEIRRRYPQFEKLFQAEEMEPALRKMEKSFKHLEDLAKNGPEAERERARAGAAAYSRTFALIREIIEKRNEMAAQAATSTPVAR